MSQSRSILNDSRIQSLVRTNINYQRQWSSPMPRSYAEDTAAGQNIPSFSRQHSDSALNDYSDGLAILSKLRNPWQIAPTVVPFNSRHSSGRIPETMELHLGGSLHYRYACTGPVVNGELTADALIAGEVSEKEFDHQRFCRYVIKSSNLPTPDGGQPCLIASAVEGKFMGIWKTTANNSLVTDVAILNDDDIVDAAERKTELVWVMKQASFEGDILWTFSPYGQSDVFLCLATPSSAESRLTVATDDGKIGKHFKFY